MGSAGKNSRRLIWLAPLALIAGVVVLGFGFALALGGADLGCLDGGRGRAAAGPVPTRSAVADIPLARLRLYQHAGRRYDIDWAFLAAVAAQECNHGPHTCPGDNGSGCAGPMQISMRRGSPCSPAPDQPTLWEQYGVDGNRDGRVDVNDPADAIPAAARILRRAKGAPPTGGSYAAYRQASCNYYGACSVYADQVMARAVQYGFQGPGSPPPTDPDGARPAPDHEAPAAGGSGCGGQRSHKIGTGPIGPVERARRPRRLALLPASIVAPGFGPQRCDARIVPNVIYLARRFRQWVTACAEIHSLAGDHPLGAAIDTVPADGDWSSTTRLARTLGWRESCAASGVAPACAKPPIRFIGYTGYPGHGAGHHLHLSWNSSAAQGQPEHAVRTTLFTPTWIDVFTIGDTDRPERGRGDG